VSKIEDGLIKKIVTAAARRQRPIGGMGGR